MINREEIISNHILDKTMSIDNGKPFFLKFTVILGLSYYAYLSFKEMRKNHKKAGELYEQK